MTLRHIKTTKNVSIKYYIFIITNIVIDKYENPIETQTLSIISNKQTLIPIEDNKDNNNDNLKIVESKKENIIDDIKEKEDKNIKTIDSNNDNANIIKANEELLLKNENMKNKMTIFIKLMKKYSQIFSNLTNNVVSHKSPNKKKGGKNNENKSKKDLIKVVKQFNKLLFNPKLNENIFQSTVDKEKVNDFLEEDNNLLINNIDNFDDNIDDNVEENENEDSYEDKNEGMGKEDLNNLIEKYESKINILLNENEILKMSKDNQTTIQNDLITKNNDLEKENSELKLAINEFSVKNDNILSQFNELKNKMIRIENDNSILIKENQDLKNELINKKHEINPNEDINLLKNELSYKNSIIKYLEELLC